MAHYKPVDKRLPGSDAVRTTLRILICLNCALLVSLAILLLSGRRARHQTEAPAEADNLPPLTGTVKPAPGASLTAEAKPFHWSQIESPDYLTYVSNLRGIGCPEQAIRVLVTADPWKRNWWPAVSPYGWQWKGNCGNCATRRQPPLPLCLQPRPLAQTQPRRWRR